MLVLILAGALFGLTPTSSFLSRLGMDLALPWAVDAKSTEGAEAKASPIVIVAIDEQTHRTPPFDQTPEVAWTPYLAEVITGLSDAGASVIGLDLIFPKTLSSPDLVPGFDRPFLKALFDVGRPGRLVLGEGILSRDVLISPYEGQIRAVGGRDNVRSLALTPDIDEINRRYPAELGLSDGGTITSFANELALRSGSQPAENGFLIDFVSTVTIPVLRLSDVLSCQQNADKNLEALFAGKIVIVGEVLDVEDRHMATNRFSQNNQPLIYNTQCEDFGEAQPGAGIDRASIPGVYIHARALQTILSGSGPQQLSPGIVFALTVLLLLAVCLLYVRLPALYGLGLLVAILLALWVGAVFALGRLIVLPYLSWAVMATLAYMIIYAYRVFFEDRQKRWIRHAFEHFLSPELVNQLTEQPESLKLGGEERQIVVLFLDLAGFTKATEDLNDRPEVLVSELNRYLARMADIIEEHGGYVDKFIGDAIMAVWGAPVVVPNPHLAATEAALACQEALVALNQENKRNKKLVLIHGMRVGVNAGSAIVGNMGSENRFNYTAVGDAVNLAARLESANKTYGTEILISADIEMQLSDKVIRREIDYVTVLGRSQPVRVYEVVDPGQPGVAADPAKRRVFEEALALYRAGDFSAAMDGFKTLAAQDPVSQLYCERCRDKLMNPPPAAWDGAEILHSK